LQWCKAERQEMEAPAWSLYHKHTCIHFVYYLPIINRYCTLHLFHPRCLNWAGLAATATPLFLSAVLLPPVQLHACIRFIRHLIKTVTPRTALIRVVRTNVMSAILANWGQRCLCWHWCWCWCWWWGRRRQYSTTRRYAPEEDPCCCYYF